jgi:hypothetical protein
MKEQEEEAQHVEEKGDVTEMEAEDGHARGEKSITTPATTTPG